MESNIKIEELVELKEQGLSDGAIVEHYDKKGIKLKKNTVAQRLYRYYKAKGQEKPTSIIRKESKGITEKKITDEELVALREQGMTYDAITEYFINQGKEISASTVYTRLKKCYPREVENNEEEITDEELFVLKEQGLTDKDIAEYFTNKGRKIAPPQVSVRLKEYYKLNGKEKPICKRQGKIQKKITDEELFDLKEQGMTDAIIVEHLKKQGRKITQNSVSLRLRKYYALKGKEKPRGIGGKNNQRIIIDQKYEDDFKYILMNGITLQEYIERFEEKRRDVLEDRLEKLRVVAECANKRNKEFVADSNFLDVLNIIENPLSCLESIVKQINIFVEDGKCKGIDLIKENVFKENTDMMVYVLSRSDITYFKGYDTRILNVLRKQYEEKIDKYLGRLNSVELNRRKNKINDENDSNSEVGVEER